MQGFSLYVFDFLKDAVSYIRYDVLFIVSAVIAVVPFLILFSLSFFIEELKNKRKISYLLGEGAYLFIFASVSVLKAEDSLTAMLFYPCLFACLCITLYAILFAQSMMLKKKAEEYEVTETLTDGRAPWLCDGLEYIRPSLCEKEANEPVLDETKLKELIEKCYSLKLSEEDREKVKKIDFLKDACAMGINAKENRAKLNDGISELINIISKQGNK